MTPFEKSAHDDFAASLISYSHLAIARAYKVHARIFVEVILFDNLLLRQIQTGPQAVHNADKKQFRALFKICDAKLLGTHRQVTHVTLRRILFRLENHLLRRLDNLIILQHIFEHVRLDALFERGRYLEEKLLQLVLLVHSDHHRVKVLSYLVAKRFGQMRIFHGCIRSVNDQLVRTFLRIRLIDQHSDLSENVRIDNGTDQVGNDEVDELADIAGTQFVTADHKHGVVDADEVDVPLVLLADILLPKLLRAIVVIIRGQPSYNI